MGPSNVKSKKRAGKLIIFLFILAFIVSVISDYSTARHLKNVCTAVTSGTVTHIRDSMDLFSKTTSIDYEYLIDGKTYRKHCFGKHDFMIAEKGDVFEVHYDPDSPNDSYIGDYPPTKGLSIANILVGMLVCFLVYIGMVKQYDDVEERKNIQ